MTASQKQIRERRQHMHLAAVLRHAKCWLSHLRLVAHLAASAIPDEPAYTGLLDKRAILDSVVMNMSRVELRTMSNCGQSRMPI
jgi:hypothetical protein